MFGTPYYRAQQMWLLDAAVSTLSFWAFIPGFRRLRARWIAVLPFALYGFVQAPLFLLGPRQQLFIITMTIVLPLSRAVLLLAWVRFLATLVHRGEATLTVARQQMARLDGPALLGQVFHVMISSTVDELLSERDAVDRAIRSLSLERFRSETMGSLPWTPKSVCEFIASRCNLFILIIGTTYGHITQPEDISIVEFEYNVARQEDRGKILVYVKRATARDPREERFLRAVEDFADGYFRSTFDTPEQLFDCVRRDVASWLARRASHPAPGGM